MSPTGGAGSDSDASPPRRQRLDSSEDDEDAAEPQRGRSAPAGRLDSSDSDGSDDSDVSVRRRPGRGITEARPTEARPTEARPTEARAGTKRARREETVYRDSKGRKLDMLTEYMRHQDAAAGKAAAEAREAYEWGQGAKQKEEDRRRAEELANIRHEPFARMRGDARVDEMQRNALRVGDPMFDYMQRKRQAAARSSGPAGGGGPRPSYSGPPAPPNRYGIRPGYRWDGVDRSTGFEQKLLAAQNGRPAQGAPRW